MKRGSPHNQCYLRCLRYGSGDTYPPHHTRDANSIMSITHLEAHKWHKLCVVSGVGICQGAGMSV